MNSESDSSGAQGRRSFTHLFGVVPLQVASGQAQWRIGHQGMIYSNLWQHYLAERHWRISMDEALWGSPRYRGLSPGAVVVGLQQGLWVYSIVKYGASPWTATNGQWSASIRLGHNMRLRLVTFQWLWLILEPSVPRAVSKSSWQWNAAT
jgi:hypothetical protein